MENNKLLIGVQFTNEVSTGKFEHYNIELFVPRDIMLSQLLEGIKYGLKKCVENGVKNSDVYEQCRGVFSQTISKTAVDENGRQYLTHVTFTSFDFNKADGVIKKGDRIAQGLFHKFLITDNDNATGERLGGIGSTK